MYMNDKNNGPKQYVHNSKVVDHYGIILAAKSHPETEDLAIRVISKIRKPRNADIAAPLSELLLGDLLIDVPTTKVDDLEAGEGLGGFMKALNPVTAKTKLPEAKAESVALRAATLIMDRVSTAPPAAAKRRIDNLHSESPTVEQAVLEARCAPAPEKIMGTAPNRGPCEARCGNRKFNGYIKKDGDRG